MMSQIIIIITTENTSYLTNNVLVYLLNLSVLPALCDSPCWHSLNFKQILHKYPNFELGSKVLHRSK